MTDNPGTKRKAAAPPARIRFPADASGFVPADNFAPMCGLRPSSALSEQARRLPHQHGDHHDVDEESPEFRSIILARDVADADQHGGDERAGDRAKPANRNDDENVDEVRERE